ncbi:MAG: glycoside hydrolase family 88 protein [Devosia sp.]
MMGISATDRVTEHWQRLIVWVAAAMFALMFAGTTLAQVPEPTEVRVTLPLMDNWHFVQDDQLSEKDALRGSSSGWQTVDLPHTWNAKDAASLKAEGYKRGVGWYRLEFDTPTEGARHWLEFGAASLLADVWLNGRYLGQHKGGFTVFRFDVTDDLRENGSNELLVKVDNTAPKNDAAPTAIPPMRGDFNVSGGLYRYVALVSTPDVASFALDDMGGPGIYATTTAISDAAATVEVRAKLSRAGEKEVQPYVEPASSPYRVRFELLDTDGRSAARAEEPTTLTPGEHAEVTGRLEVDKPHLWQGVDDPHLYRLVATLVREDGTTIDEVVQHFGIRQMRFDPKEGLFLNGRHIGRLNGVGMHQDLLGKAWAITDADTDNSLALIREMGANAVRFAHYPYSQHTYERASELGLIAWAEAAFGIYTRVKRCAKEDPTPEFAASAKEQLQELIRQNYNHASIATWAIGNESTQGQLNCSDPYDNVTPLLHQMQETAKEEDPSRPTVYAEYPHPVERSGPFATEGITDLFATNRYFLWYTPEFADFSPLLDSTLARTPDQPLAVSEYGAGAALSHHTDNPLGGYPDRRSAPVGQVAYQPEEYAAFVHEENYRVIASKPYLWGSFVWDMFDFGSDHRNEGDVLGVNTKGLVAFDHRTRKDPFYFYQANWSILPVTHIVGHRYTDRAYPVVDVKVYSNASSVELSVNDKPVGKLEAAQCEQRTCVFKNVTLQRGVNRVTAIGQHAGGEVRDVVDWSLNSSDVNIAAGRLASGLVDSTGAHFGSDNFFSGGNFGPSARETTAIDVFAQQGDDTQAQQIADGLLYLYYRLGTFSYEIPIADGHYEVTLGFIEPNTARQPGERVFDVIANGKTALDHFDVVKTAGGPRLPTTRTFPVEVTDGQLSLEFRPSAGEAIVSNIRVKAIGGAAAALAAAPKAEAKPSGKPELPGGGPSPEAVLRTIRHVADWALENPASYEPGSWIMAPLYDGLLDASLATGDPRYLAPVVRAGRCLDFTTGSRTYHADGQAAGRVWLRLYQMSDPKDPALLEPWTKLFDQIVQNPITQEWVFGEEPPYGRSVTDRWVWADALYMSPPTILALFDATGNKRYLQFMDDEFRFAYEILFDPEANLFYRDSRFVGERTPAGRKVFWARANGWVLAGLALVLELLPDDYPSRPFYVDLFQKMSRAIADAQQPDGFWNPSLLDATHVPLPEASATGLFVRAFASGIRQGLLDAATYWPLVQRGWNALGSAIRPDGEVYLVQPPAPEPRVFNPASSVPYGTGAVLGAGVEILRTLGEMPKGEPAALLQMAKRQAGNAGDLWEWDGSPCGQGQTSQPEAAGETP